jgi:hypothetical protein
VYTYYYYLIELQIVSGTAIRHTTQKYTSHKITHHVEIKRSTQAIKATLRTVNTMQKSKAIPVTGCGGL